MLLSGVTEEATGEPHVPAWIQVSGPIPRRQLLSNQLTHLTLQSSTFAFGKALVFELQLGTDQLTTNIAMLRQPVRIDCIGGGIGRIGEDLLFELLVAHDL